mmetsp:Transcript_19148/g.30188  ORF Transcript_19148/g.30188 Transcript_19148/m.30188 type:complete len:89 (-) Transcript_19148:573-839(-)
MNQRLKLGKIAKLAMCVIKVDDVVEKERRYEGMEVIKTPAQIGKKAPDPKSQQMISTNLKPKPETLILRGPGIEATTKKAHATRSALV